MKSVALIFYIISSATIKFTFYVSGWAHAFFGLFNIFLIFLYLKFNINLIF